MPLDLLVTGFGPFPGAAVNPSGPLARVVAHLARKRGLDAKALVLHTSYGRGLPTLGAALHAQAPQAVLMLGLASRDRQVRVERLARSGGTALLCDASGRRSATVCGTAAALPSTARPAPALAVLRRHGLSARLSMSAGRYLCNAAYAVALDWARQSRRPSPVLFIHIPRLQPRPGLLPLTRLHTALPRRATLDRALAAIAMDLARQTRR